MIVLEAVVSEFQAASAALAAVFPDRRYPVIDGSEAR